VTPLRAEEQTVLRVALNRPEAVLLALGRVGLAALIEIAARLLAVLDEVLVRLRHHLRVQRHQRVLVAAVRVEDAIAG
jgi:hypothetical protein